MTCRSLLWIAAAAVSVGAATANPSLAAAAAGPGAGWTITIDQPTAEAVVASKHLTIRGIASHGTGVDAVTVTVAPQGLPPQCGPATGPAVVDGQSFAIELDVSCNGPHEIHVVAESTGHTASGEPRPVGVAERPPQPAPPRTDVTAEGGLRATWDPSDDPDADGTILVVNFREDHFDAGIGEATLPPSDRNAAVAVRTLRWGAGGPGTTITSPESGGTYIGPNPIDPNEPDKPEPSESPPSEPPATPPPPPADGPASTTPSPHSGGTTAPSSTRAPSTTTAPADPTEAQPAAATVAAWPETSRWPWSDAEERAVSTTTGGSGLVRTSDERPPARVVPLALALLIITVAAGIAWRSRRTRPRSWGNRLPPVHRRQHRGAYGADLRLTAHAGTDLGLLTVGRPTRHRRVTSGTGSPRATRRRQRRTHRPRT